MDGCVQRDRDRCWRSHRPPPALRSCWRRRARGAQDYELECCSSSRGPELDAPVERVSVGNPDVADLSDLTRRSSMCSARTSARPTCCLWDAPIADWLRLGRSHARPRRPETKAHQLLPASRSTSSAAQRSIVLTGRCRPPRRMNAAVRLAEAISRRSARPRAGIRAGTAQSQDRTAGQVINLMQIGGAQQVMLEVKVAEIARTELRIRDGVQCHQRRRQALERRRRQWRRHLSGCAHSSRATYGFRSSPNRRRSAP